MKTTQFKNCHATIVEKPSSVGDVKVFYSYTTPQAVKVYGKWYILEGVRGSRTTSKQLTRYFGENEKQRRKSEYFTYVKPEDERMEKLNEIIQQLTPERYF